MRALPPEIRRERATAKKLADQRERRRAYPEEKRAEVRAYKKALNARHRAEERAAREAAVRAAQGLSVPVGGGFPLPPAGKRPTGRPRGTFKPPEQLDEAGRERARKYLDELEERLRKQLELAKAADPFWWYEPSTGDVTPERRGFLEKYLKPEDVPAKLVGQVDFHRATAPVRGASGGNQSGKTLSCAIEVLIFATGQVPVSMRAWYPKEKLPPPDLKVRRIRVVGENWEDGILKNVLPTYQNWVPREYLKDGEWKKSFSAEQATLTLYDPATKEPCATIEFMSNVQEIGSFQGPPRDMIAFDEEPRWDVYKENLFRFVTASRVNIIFGMTPTRGISWVKQELVDKFQTDAGHPVEWCRLATVGNPKANLSVVAFQVQNLTYEERRMRLLGEFVSLSGLMYGGVFSRAQHVVRPFPFWCTCEGWREKVHAPACPWNHYVVYRGLDPHLVTNTACVWVAVDREEHHYVGHAYFDDADTEQVKKDIYLASAKMRLSFSVCDSAADVDVKAFGGRNSFAELKSGPFGIRPLRLASKGPNSIKPGVDALKDQMKAGKLLVMDTPENRPLVNAFETMERDRWANEGKKGPKDKILESKHHLHAALRYVESYRLPWRSPEDQVRGVALPGDPMEAFI